MRYKYTPIMITALVLTIALALGLYVAYRTQDPSRSQHQFPTHYQLLRESPGIDRRERWAVGLCVALLVLFAVMGILTYIL